MTNRKVSICNTEGDAKRVPVPLSGAEAAALERLAVKEKRSQAQMAKIIYQLGFKAYAAKRKAG